MADPVDAFQFPIRIDRALGRVKREPDYEKYVAQLIRQVLLTAPGERPHRPDFGAGLRRMVFSPNDDAAVGLVQTTVFQNLNQWLGMLITVDDVRATSSDSRLDVTILYTLKARGTRQVLNLEVTA
jgi:phage baseplate assembly protein W